MRAAFIFIFVWEMCARILAWPVYFIPAPSHIARQIFTDINLLKVDFLATAYTTALAIALAFLFAFVLASATHLNKLFRAFSKPFAFILQVTPIIALAPLLLIYMKPAHATLVIAVLIAFYPLYAGFLSGFNAVAPAQEALFKLYKASILQKFWLLELPASRPFVVAAFEVSSGLALVGTIVGEFTAGVGQGLAIRLLESQYRLNIPRVYACLVLIVLLGGGIKLVIKLMSKMHFRLKRGLLVK